MPSVIVKLIADNGLLGYGEAVPDEHVTGEAFYSISGNPSAKAAIDIACYDLMGKYTKLPIYDLLGGKFHESLSFAKVLSIDDDLWAGF